MFVVSFKTALPAPESGAPLAQLPALSFVQLISNLIVD
jgi:hypothetical protein